MQSYLSVVENWLSAVAEQQLDTTFQVVETNSSDVLVQKLLVHADRNAIQTFTIEYHAKLVADPFDIIHSILNWYGESFGHEKIVELIDRTAYSLQVEVLKHWYQRESFHRSEPLLYDEAGYEQTEFFESIEALLHELAQWKPFVIIINHIDFAPAHLMELLSRFLESSHKQSRWGVLGFIQQSRRSQVAKEDSAWFSCLKQLERSGLVLPVTIDHKTDQPFDWQTPTTLKKFSDQYRMIVTAADMFAYQDVIRMVRQVRQKYNDQHNGQLLFISAFSSLMKGDLDIAEKDFAKVQNRLQATGNQAILIASYFWLSICYTLKSQEKFARGAQEQCEKLAIEYDDSRWYALSQFAAFYIDAHIAQHHLTQSSLESLRYLLSELGYTNILSLLLTQVYSHSDHYDQVSSKTYLNNCVQALRYSRKRRNMLGISMALHAMGVVYMRTGNFSQTRRLFEFSLNIREQYQRKADLVPMLNGLGYFLVGQEDWLKAWKLYDKALSLLIKHRNFNEVSITLYNFAWLYSQSGNVQRALDIMNDLLELMRIRGVESVPFRNLKDLYVLKGWLHMTLQQPIQARYCLTRVKKLQHLHQTSFSQILSKILSARIAYTEDEKPLAIRDNHQALALVNESNDLDTYLDSTLRLEISRLFVDLGRRDDATPILSALRKKAFDFNLDTLAQRISKASLGITSTSVSIVPNITQPYHILLELAQKEAQMTRLQHELSDIHQVNLLVQKSATEPDLKKFLAQSIDILDRRVPANDFGILVKSHENMDHAVEYRVTNEVSETVVDGWLACLKGKRPTDVRFEFGGHHCAAWPLNMGSAEVSWLVVSGDSHQQAVWNESLLKLVAQQLGLILDRRLREALLEHRNKTDLLTGVLNRAGIYGRLKKIFAQMQRQPTQPFALCYFDLDHFKYFNDQFGHELGDRVLENLVKCIEQQLRGSDELGRIGGDEFIILLKDSGSNEVKPLLERLRSVIAAPDWWLPLVTGAEDTSNNPVPQNEWISASFGVVYVDHWPEEGLNEIELLAQGDAAMYEAKAAGRNCVIVKDYRTSDSKTDSQG
jgi:diguanylate cyclase (GGDEF)-like protein